MNFHRIARAALAAVILSGISTFSARADGFYTPAASEVAGRPGTLIRAQKFTPPPGASAAYRVLYRSTNGAGKPIAVSGMVVVPDKAVPQGGRKVVSWAHATSGVARQCARSLHPSLFTTIYGLPDLLAQGIVVAATDYPGLGGPGVHPYLIGVDQGNSVIDIARAARALPDAQAGSEFAVAGYSQGGQAALYAGILAKGYAPELDLVAIAAAAPPTDLKALIRATQDDPVGRVFATYAIASWSRLYDIPLDGVITKSVRLVVDNMAGVCNIDSAQSLRLLFTEQAFEREGFLQRDVTAMSPWKELLAKNSPGPTPKGVPVFIAQGMSDRIVRPAVTQNYVEKLCARGTHLTLVPVRGGHVETGPGAGKPMAAWLADRFAGKAAPSDCGAAQVQIRKGRSTTSAPPVKAVQSTIPLEKRFYVVDAQNDVDQEG